MNRLCNLNVFSGSILLPYNMLSNTLATAPTPLSKTSSHLKRNDAKLSSDLFIRRKIDRKPQTESSTCMSHEHEHVWECDRREPTGKIFTDRKHGVQDLCKWICEYVERAASYNCANRQRKARERLRNGSFDKYWIEDGHTTQDIADAYFNIFDNLFFFGSLGEKCMIKANFGTERLLAVTKPLKHSFLEGVYVCAIEFSPEYSGDLQTDMTMLLETLLHEM